MEGKDLLADEIRARELYKYFRPPEKVLASEPPNSPDSTLTSFAQLVTWRLGMQRALVSVIDRETQYFVCEATKTLDLEDTTRTEEPSDAIWAGVREIRIHNLFLTKFVLTSSSASMFPGPEGFVNTQSL